MSNNIQNILDEEFKLLIRATRNELFHFISVQYNHYDLVRKVKKDLVAQYPNRPVHTFNLDNCNPATFIQDILASKSGLVFIEKFDLIFTESFRSLCIGFNQRRDLFSTFPIQIIVFIPSGEGNLQHFQKAMPDVFSIVNPMIQLYQKTEQSKAVNTSTDNDAYNFTNIEEAKSEVERIEKRLKTLENTPENARLVVSLKINLAKSYRFIGEYLKSKVLLEELLRELQTNNNVDFENAVSVIENDLATVLKSLGDYEGAKKLLEKTIISAENKLGEKHPNTASVYSNLATTLRALGDYEGAKKLLKKALISVETNFGKKHPNTASVYSNLATVLRDLGDYEGAKKLLEKALISVENNFGEKHPNTASVYSNLASVLQDLGDFEGAKKLLEKALISTETNFGENHPNTASSYSNLATALQSLGDYEGAKKLLEKAIISDETNFGENHPTTAVRYSNLALILKNLGDYEGAKKLLEKATISAETNFGEKHPDTAVRYSNLAVVYYDLRDFQNAIILLEKAYKIYQNHLGGNHPQTKIIKSNLDFVKEQMK